MSAGREELIELLEPEVVALGFELSDLEIRLGGGRGQLRLFIDHADGVGLADCEKVSRQVSAILDVEDPIPGDYNLEVSSPGLDRKLVKEEHFDRFAGENVRVKLRRPIEGKRKYRGILLAREDDEIVIKEGEDEIRIPLVEVDIARVIPG